MSILMLIGCPVYDPPSGTLVVHNYSDAAIYVYETCADSIENKDELKLFLVDSTNRLDAKGNRVLPMYSPSYRINAYSYGTLYGYGSRKNKSIDCQNKKLNLFFISENTMRNYAWDDIVSGQLYEIKMNFTETQLDSLDWKIRYLK